MKIEMVEWVDAVSEANWVTKDNVLKPSVCVTIGVVQEHDGFINIYSEWQKGEHDDISHQTSLPNGMVVSRKVIYDITD